MTKEQQIQLKDKVGMLQQDCWIKYKTLALSIGNDEQCVAASKEVDDLIPGKVVRIVTKVVVQYV